MRALTRNPLAHSMLVVLVACLAVFLLSACLARSGPDPETLPEPAETELEEPPEELEPPEEPEVTPVPGAADLAVSAWHNEMLFSGATAEYVVVYENYDWQFLAEDVVLEVTLPEGAALSESTRNEEPFPPSKDEGGVLEYALGTLLPGDYGEILLSVQLPELSPGSGLVLAARIAGTEPDPDPDNNYSQDEGEIPAPDLSVGVYPTDECGPFAPGRPVSYIVAYSNWSELPVESVVLTSTLSSGMTFRQAFLVEGDSRTPLSPAVAGGELSFDLGTVEPGAYGELLLEAGLDETLFPDQPLTCTAGITVAPGELMDEDNVAWSEEYAQVEGPDPWVQIEASAEGEIDEGYGYYIAYGNRGTAPAAGVSLSLELPSQLRDVTFDPEPDTLANGIATWQLGALEEWTGGDIYVEAVIGAAGPAVAKVTIQSAGADVDPRNNTAESSAEFMTLRMPVIAGPSEARVGAQPVVFGMGKPEATVSLYLAGEEGSPDQLIGSTVVGEDGLWEITPTTKLPQPGWYWFTASQEFEGRVSPLTGVGNYYSDQITIDTNSLTVNGQRVGGIDQTIEWLAGETLTFGARIIACQEPLTPTLQVRYYNEQGLMVNHKKIRPKLTRPGGYVEFDFTVPDGDSGLQWQLELGYYCREELQTGVIGRSRGLAAPLAGVSDLWHPECWFGGCNKDEEPAPKNPPPGCKGCTPIQRPKKRPRPVDPDGMVYDEALLKAGATMAQAAITRAEVTCLQQNAEGRFEPWNALEYNQVNPQVTDAQYPDRVLRPGYYSFLVPPGFYRIQVTAPGFMPFESHTLQVFNTPVTLDIPLRRAPGARARAD